MTKFVYKKEYLYLVVGILLGVVAISIAWPTRDSQKEINPIIGFNCELSGGEFEFDKCVCPIEEQLGQTQEMMYDKITGFCNTTAGGPGGDAFAAMVGLPHRSFVFWTAIIGNLCEQSGGEWLNARCTCLSELNYDESSGLCR